MPAAAETYELAVVMPCLNEALTVGRCVAKARACLDRLGILGEIIVADNGSSDGSQELARQAGARVVAVDRPGYGSALQGGISAAQSRFVIVGDADDSYDFTQLDAFVERLRQGDDLVMGNRFRGGIKPGAMPWLHRYVGNPLLTGILNLFFRTPIGDAHCGLRGIRKDAFERLHLTTTGMEFASEMVVKASLQGLKISEVPTTLSPDGRARRPHLRSFRDGWRHLRFLLLMCPFWLYLIPATLLIATGLGLMIWLTPGPRIIGAVVIDLHTMLLGAFCVLLGYQTLWLWLCAETHACAAGLASAQSLSMRLGRMLTLERGLVGGAVLTCAGLGLNLWLVNHWWSLGMGPLDLPVTFRCALWGFLLIVTGVQTIYGSFFLSMQLLSYMTGRKEHIMASASKTIIVTGASQGIGAAVVRTFLDHGYRVVANSRRITESGAFSSAENIALVDGDIGDPRTAAQIARAAIDRFGSIDALVNNAGIFFTKRFIDYTAEDFRALVSTNLEGFFHLTQLAVKQMLAQKSGGSIVTITASLADNPIAGVTAAVPMITKGGLNAITYQLAMEYARDGIRVNAVAPGVVATPLHKNTPADVMKNLSPMGRVSTAEEIAEAVLYLTEAQTVTGEVLHVDGGAHRGKW